MNVCSKDISTEAFSPPDVAIIDAHALTRLSGATSTKFRYFLIVYFFRSLASHVRWFLASDICDPDRGLISRAHPESRAPSTPRTPRTTLVIHSPQCLQQSPSVSWISSFQGTQDRYSFHREPQRRLPHSTGRYCMLEYASRVGNSIR